MSKKERKQEGKKKRKEKKDIIYVFKTLELLSTAILFYQPGVLYTFMGIKKIVITYIQIKHFNI